MINKESFVVNQVANFLNEVAVKKIGEKEEMYWVLEKNPEFKTNNYYKVRSFAADKFAYAVNFIRVNHPNAKLVGTNFSIENVTTEELAQWLSEDKSLTFKDGDYWFKIKFESGIVGRSNGR